MFLLRFASSHVSVVRSSASVNSQHRQWPPGTQAFFCSISAPLKSCGVSAHAVNRFLFVHLLNRFEKKKKDILMLGSSKMAGRISLVTNHDPHVLHS